MFIPTVYFSETEGDFITATGGTEYTWISGSYIWKSHIFTNGTVEQFNVTQGTTTKAKVLVVAGGGVKGYGNYDAGALFYTSGGGGGGGMIEQTQVLLTSGSYNVLAGEGGSKFSSPYPSSPTSGDNGTNSYINGNGYVLTSIGGGGGGGANLRGKDGGSGGGAGGNSFPGLGIEGQGFDGGPWYYNASQGARVGGGGGGAGQVGGTNGTTTGGDGKISTLYYGLSAYYAGGGYSSINVFEGKVSLGDIGKGTSDATTNGSTGIVIISYPFQKISPFRTQLCRFTPTINGTLEYIKPGTGNLTSMEVSSSVDYDVCIVSGSQWNVYYNDDYFPTVNDSITLPKRFANASVVVLSEDTCT